MKNRNSFGYVLLLVVALAWGMYKSPSDPQPLISAQPGVRVSRPEVKPAADAGLSPVVNAHRSEAQPTIDQLKGELGQLSDQELRNVAATAGEEVRRTVAADPTGKFRSDYQAREIGQALNRESAARIILIDRTLESARRKYL